MLELWPEPPPQLISLFFLLLLSLATAAFLFLLLAKRRYRITKEKQRFRTNNSETLQPEYFSSSSSSSSSLPDSDEKAKRRRRFVTMDKDNNSISDHKLSEDGGGLKFEVSSCAIQGRRPYMEDRRTIIDDLFPLMDPNVKQNTLAEKCSIFAVFDGHGGQLASTFASAQLHDHLIKSSYFPNDPVKALEEACEFTDRAFAEKHQGATSQDGTTACIVLLMGQRLFVANVGDSRAVLCRKGQLFCTQILPFPPSFLPSFQAKCSIELQLLYLQ